MNIGELKAILAQYPDDLIVTGAVESRWSLEEMRVALRDMIDRDTGKLEKTVLNIRHWNYGKEVGLPHLTEDERAKQRKKILDGLSDVRSPLKGKSRRFTSVHGDYRIYHSYGGGDDTCYGTAYDPRLFAELEAEGLIQRSAAETYSRIPNYSITDAGMAAIIAMTLVSDRE